MNRQVVRKLLPEVGCLLFGVWCAWVLANRGHLGFALGALACSGLAAGLGAALAFRNGELQLAWHCPRLDRLALRTNGRDLPWKALRAVDAVVAALEKSSAPSLFVGAKLELLKAASRVVDAHRVARRAREALHHAPPGEGRRMLERQASLADAELVRLTALSSELRARLAASAQPVATVEDPTSSLEAIARTSDALVQAREELHVAAPSFTTDRAATAAAGRGAAAEPPVSLPEVEERHGSDSAPAESLRLPLPVRS